ncbi:uncharacterized protein [Drosophila suzukii]|uniref:Uncharacterized protein n=1 Tax=Drosophila suzukii TaxID=28584 RepID=A0AB39ZS81_DROSZ
MPCCSRWRRTTEDPSDANELRVFAHTVYIKAVVLCSVSAFLLMIISSLKFSVVSVLPVPPYIWLLLALGILVVLACLPVRRLRKLVIWSMVCGIVALVTLTGACYVRVYDVTDLVIYIASMLLVMIPLLICGAKCRKPCLPNVLFTGVVVCLCLVALFPLGILALLSHRYYFVAFSAVLFVMGVVILPLQAQFIHGRLRYEPLDLEPICSLAFFIDAWILVFCICVFVCTIEVELIGDYPEHLAGLSTVPR